MTKKRQSKKDPKKEYILNLVKTSTEVYAGFGTVEEAKQRYSKEWFNAFYSRNSDFTVEQLLNPVSRKLSIEYDAKTPRHSSCLKGYNGIWRIVITPRSKKSLDFTIGVMAGKVHRFHSDAIRIGIVSHHGKEAYEKWRNIVRDDIASLRELVTAIRHELRAVPWSYTCSQSSENLCKRVGINTYRGVAFLFPDSFH